MTLAATLGVTMPVAASMAGTATASPLIAPSLASSRAPAPDVSRVIHRARAHPTVYTQVLAAEGSHGDLVLRTRWSRPNLLVRIPPGGVVARRYPRMSAGVVGTVAAASKYYGVPITLWVEATRRGGWGRVELPYVWPRRDGWIRLGGLDRSRTPIHVVVDLSEHRVRVYDRTRLLFAVAGATGRASSPTPPGQYAVTDRVPFGAGSDYGSFAFGISGIQPHLPPGWTGGNQLAIHGTNDPGSIGTSASAGCVRVSEASLGRLRPLLQLGTPVIIHA